LQEIIKLLFNNKPADLNWLSTLKKLVKTEELDLGKAIEYANVLHQELPTYKNIYSRLAYFLTSLNKYEEADSLFCLDAKSGNQTWWGKLRHAECIALSGDMDKALTMVNDVYSASYDAVNGFGHLGWTLLREQRITEAEAAELILKDVSLDRMTIGFKLVAAPIIAFIDKETSIKLVQEAYDANKPRK
jgi:tetratricopeptide (TPR) repeat protein